MLYYNVLQVCGMRYAVYQLYVGRREDNYLISCALENAHMLSLAGWHLCIKLCRKKTERKIFLSQYHYDKQVKRSKASEHTGYVPVFPPVPASLQWTRSSSPPPTLSFAGTPRKLPWHHFSFAHSLHAVCGHTRS